MVTKSRENGNLNNKPQDMMETYRTQKGCQLSMSAQSHRQTLEVTSSPKDMNKLHYSALMVCHILHNYSRQEFLTYAVTSCPKDFFYLFTHSSIKKKTFQSRLCQMQILRQRFRELVSWKLQRHWQKSGDMVGEEEQPQRRILKPVITMVQDVSILQENSRCWQEGLHGLVTRNTHRTLQGCQTADSEVSRSEVSPVVLHS